MAKKLMIVESPTKTKTISQYIGKDFDITASMGHIRDLPRKKFGIDIEDDFKPHYVINSDKRKTVRNIKNKAKKATEIYLASDNDREGEAIAWHLQEILKGIVDKDDIYRVVFNEITNQAIQESIKNPGHVDIDKVEAQQARRMLDRIVGYKVSPILWKVIAKRLSAGRVQTVALRLICEREEKIRKFKPKEYWNIYADLKKNLEFSAQLKKYNRKKAKIPNENKATEIYDYIKKQKFIVSKIEQKKQKLSPYPAFTTSTLQQEASRRLGFSTKRTMQIAQQLYEGVDIKGDNYGLITYMRTDSVRIADGADAELRNFIKNRFGKKYLNNFRRKYKNKSKTQDAHEAIRPTSSNRTPDSLKQFLNKSQYKLYSLIWKRFVATQMRPAKIMKTKLETEAGKAIFLTRGSIIDFDGFMKVYPHVYIRNRGEKLPDLEKGDEVDLIKLTKEQKFTKPPSRYSEATLVKKLEKENIGRPSTYSPTISTLLNRKYVYIKKKRFYPTDLGMIVEEFLVDKLEDFFNVSFTAKMENFLDEIEAGNKDYIKALRDFYDDFMEQVNSIDVKKEKKKIAKETDIKCEKCGSPMVIRWSKQGPFLGCSNFPKCKNTKNFTRDEKGNIQITKPTVSEEKCPKCGGDLVLKEGRYGKFWACSNFPKCKFTKPHLLEEKCPECGNALVKRKNSKKRTFYGCSAYPKCKFITNKKPVKIECPECGAPTMFVKSKMQDSAKLVCLKCKKEIIK
ncbi:MAG: type I DNA topoisomerase [Candidatus Cloacimonetes bacterium]|nr:type I DNA topoisomerase [Candidatus Cloacimonadota bacterium]MBS3766866.1 type I DNA topoisomerase [Candidatus Cloacimonadota bacterium]